MSSYDLNGFIIENSLNIEQEIAQGDFTFEDNLTVDGVTYLKDIVVSGKITGADAIFNNAIVQGTPHLIINEDEKKDDSIPIDTGYAMKYRQGSNMKYAGLYLEKDSNEFILYKNSGLPSATMTIPNISSGSYASSIQFADLNVGTLGAGVQINCPDANVSNLLDAYNISATDISTITLSATNNFHTKRIESEASFKRVFPTGYDYNGNDILNYLQAEIASATSGDVIDLTHLRGTYYLSDTLNINKSVTLNFGPCEIVFNSGNILKNNNEFGEANYQPMFKIDAIRNVKIRGVGRLKGSTTIHGNYDTLFRIDDDTLGCCILGSDCDGLEIENCSFSHSMDKAGSNGIKLYTMASDNISYITMRNVFIYKFSTRGLYIEHPVTSIFDNVRVSSCAESCWYLSNGTSCTLNACYASGSLRNGFLMDTMTYSTLNACASEACGTAFKLENCFNMSLLACGAERQMNRAIRYNTGGGQWEVVDDFKTQIGHGYVCQSGGFIKFDNCYYKDPPSRWSSMFIVDRTRNVSILTPRFKIADAWIFKDPTESGITGDYAYDLSMVSPEQLADFVKYTWDINDDVVRRILMINGNKECYLYLEADFDLTKVIGTGWKGFIGDDLFIKTLTPSFTMQGNDPTFKGVISYDKDNKRLKLDSQGFGGTVRLYANGVEQLQVRSDKCEFARNVDILGDLVVKGSFSASSGGGGGGSSSLFNIIYDGARFAWDSVVLLVNGAGEAESTVRVQSATVNNVKYDIPLTLAVKTNVERDLLADISNGAMIYNSSSGRPQYFNSGDWFDWIGLNRTSNIFNIPTTKVGINKSNPTDGALDVNANLIVSGSSNISGVATFNNRIVMNGRSIVLANLSTAQRNALPALSNGSIIYNTTTAQAEIYSAGSWSALGGVGGGAGFTGSYAGNTNFIGNHTQDGELYINNTGVDGAYPAIRFNVAGNEKAKIFIDADASHELKIIDSSASVALGFDDQYSKMYKTLKAFKGPSLGDFFNDNDYDTGLILGENGSKYGRLKLYGPETSATTFLNTGYFHLDQRHLNISTVSNAYSEVFQRIALNFLCSAHTTINFSNGASDELRGDVYLRCNDRIIEGFQNNIKGNLAVDGAITSLGAVSVPDLTITGTTTFGSLANMPRMSESTRDAQTPIGGSVCFNTSINKLQVFDGAYWVNLH